MLGDQNPQMHDSCLDTGGQVHAPFNLNQLDQFSKESASSESLVFENFEVEDDMNINKEPLMGTVEHDISDSGSKVVEINKPSTNPNSLLQSLSAVSNKETAKVEFI